MIVAAMASRAPSTGGIAIPATRHVVGAPLESAEPVAPPSTATVLARTTAHIRGPWTVVEPPIKIVQLESQGSYFTALVAPECGLPEIGERVALETRTFQDNADVCFDALVVSGRHANERT
jgi:uncharacterized OB-fold protein